MREYCLPRLLTLSPDQLNVFAVDYPSAREQILSVSRQCPVLEDHYSRVLPDCLGANDESLSTEILWLGPESANKVVVLISATHGVEGFVGAAVQTDLLKRLTQGYQLPVDTAVLIIFALNPFGFSHYRRCDEQGIDLNRNFIDFSQPLPDNAGYRQLQSAIYCEEATQRQKQFTAFSQRYGQTEFEIALSGGQYTDASGPFYGGVSAAHGRKTIEKVMTDYQLQNRQLAVIDVHSGLGPYGYGELINDHPVNSTGFVIANTWYGASVTAPVSGDSSSVPKLGLLDYQWHRLMQERGCFITLEFGSYRTEALFDVILQDHRSWHKADKAAIQKSAQAMKEHFCPEDAYWRELVIVKARQVIQLALEGLQHD